MALKVDATLDAKGLTCPVPIVKTKQLLGDLASGQVIEVQATDQGSTADIQAWAKSTGRQYLGTVQEGDVLRHYLRKSDPDETEEEPKHPNVTSLEDLKEKIDDPNATIVDVREPAEYAFGHIPGAKSMPLGELESHVDHLNTRHNKGFVDINATTDGIHNF